MRNVIPGESNDYPNIRPEFCLPGDEGLRLLVHTEAVTEEDGAGLDQGLREEEGEQGDDEGRPGGVVVGQV